VNLCGPSAVALIDMASPDELYLLMQQGFPLSKHQEVLIHEQFEREAKKEEQCETSDSAVR
jgi:hypothetical protein